MKKFFEKYEVDLDESDAINAMIHKLKQVKKKCDKNLEYDECLKELSEMIDDFFEYRDQ